MPSDSRIDTAVFNWKSLESACDRTPMAGGAISGSMGNVGNSVGNVAVHCHSYSEHKVCLSELNPSFPGP